MLWWACGPESRLFWISELARLKEINGLISRSFQVSSGGSIPSAPTARVLLARGAGHLCIGGSLARSRSKWKAAFLLARSPAQRRRGRWDSRTASRAELCSALSIPPQRGCEPRELGMLEAVSAKWHLAAAPEAFAWSHAQGLCLLWRCPWCFCEAEVWLLEGCCCMLASL